MDTEALRDSFHFGGLFAAGEARLLYTQSDRMIIGGILPDGTALTIDEVKECGTASILDRREIGVLNLGDAADVSVPAETFTLNRDDVLYLDVGSGPISFGSGGKFYIVSTHAHKPLPAKLIKIEDAGSVKMGASETAND